MEQEEKVRVLRDMLNLAKRLRISAGTTEDGSYTDLFLSAALMLEDRASLLAFGRPDAARPNRSQELHAMVNILC